MVAQVFGEQLNAYLVYYPDRQTLMVAPASDELFKQLHKVSQHMLKGRNMKGDKTIALHEILIDHQLDDIDRDLDFEWKAGMGILKYHFIILVMSFSSDFSHHSQPEVPGQLADMQLLKEDGWLMNTEVRYFLRVWKNRWHLTMIYIALDDPMKLICRRIDDYSSEKKALTFAKILQRGIRKDARGTLKINRDAFNICNN